MAKPPRLLPIVGAERPEVIPLLAQGTPAQASAPDAPPRNVRLLIGRSPSGARCLLAASLWPLASCGATHTEPDGALPPFPEGGTPAGLDAGVDAAHLDAAPLPDVPAVVDEVPPMPEGGVLDPRYPFDVRDASGPSCGGEVVFAQLPPEGVPAELHQICMRPATDLVQSGWAARLVLEPDPSAVNRARGYVEIAPELSARVLGTPQLQVVAQGFQNFRFAAPSLAANGRYDVSAQWDGGGLGYFESWRHVVATIRFDVSCDSAQDGGAGDAGSARRSVEARTEMYLCNEREEARWISSGEACHTCAIIAEMAPSPIVPMPRASELPLESVVRLNVRTIAVVGHDLLVYAEHDGGARDAEYSWHPSAGTLEPLADDVVLWRLPPECTEPQLLQVVVDVNSAVAVASLRFQGALA